MAFHGPFHDPSHAPPVTFHGRFVRIVPKKLPAVRKVLMQLQAIASAPAPAASTPHGALRLPHGQPPRLQQGSHLLSSVAGGPKPAAFGPAAASQKLTAPAAPPPPSFHPPPPPLKLPQARAALPLPSMVAAARPVSSQPPSARGGQAAPQPAVPPQRPQPQQRPQQQPQQRPPLSHLPASVAAASATPIASHSRPGGQRLLQAAAAARPAAAGAASAAGAAGVGASALAVSAAGMAHPASAAREAEAVAKAAAAKAAEAKAAEAKAAEAKAAAASAAAKRPRPSGADPPAVPSAAPVPAPAAAEEANGNVPEERGARLMKQIKAALRDDTAYSQFKRTARAALDAVRRGASRNAVEFDVDAAHVGLRTLHKLFTTTKPPALVPLVSDLEAHLPSAFQGEWRRLQQGYTSAEGGDRPPKVTKH